MPVRAWTRNQTLQKGTQTRQVDAGRKRRWANFASTWRATGSSKGRLSSSMEDLPLREFQSREQSARQLLIRIYRKQRRQQHVSTSINRGKHFLKLDESVRCYATVRLQC